VHVTYNQTAYFQTTHCTTVERKLFVTLHISLHTILRTIKFLSDLRSSVYGNTDLVVSFQMFLGRESKNVMDWISAFILGFKRAAVVDDG